jgi:hypothetical protein
VGES